jgi:RNA polymerase sigma-70 factor (ECF subfamily)
VDEAALMQALNAEFRVSLIRYFSRRMPGGDSDDMVQDVFLRLSQRGNLQQIEQLGGYVFQTASSVLRDRLRKRRYRSEDAHCSFDPEQHGDVDFSPERVLLGKERLERAEAILRELPERTRVIFVLRRIENMRYSEIAAQLGVSVSAVEKHMLRAVRALAAKLDD